VLIELKSATLFPASHRSTVYVTHESPKGWHKTRFCCFFFSKFQLLSKIVWCKVSSCENIQRQSCSYIIPLSNGPWMDRGRRPNLPKICPLSDARPSENADFDRFRLIVPQAWELARIAIIANTKSTTRFPSSHRWTLCVTPNSLKGWLKTRIFTFGVAFHFFVAGNRRHFKFNTWVEHSKSQPTDGKPSLEWVWSRHVTHFEF